jgi:hypothetical protein
MPPQSEDNYDDSPTPPPAATPDKSAPQDDDDDGGKTSILPRSFFAGKDLKVGDKCDVTVTAIHENDVEVAPCDPSDKEDDQPPAEEDSTPPDAPAPPQEGSMASMMQ